MSTISLSAVRRQYTFPYVYTNVQLLKIIEDSFLQYLIIFGSGCFPLPKVVFAKYIGFRVLPESMTIVTTTILYMFILVHTETTYTYFKHNDNSMHVFTNNRFILRSHSHVIQLYVTH